ncbi:MAG TPA: adenylate/guanylate cyclase domain-containing protein [Bradyrhizobium sp.]|uniref:adenylate/guanylate cyclase domain-containing protein n=1 Tax=Bradyrhizobium sp. TaxID=376 RepID=UPI002B8FB956|nr:adenylate/guanylate cyclase domain-containing protein [Bradyrhizobium sp.]HLZ03769.1 adenylate/guanylate cyclase domain-containing protein [Bradyrhizobium sp.]
MDLGNWLRNQGLERFEATFRDNGIDETVLPHLTQDHLRELGLPMGARIKLLAAIAELAKEAERLAPAPISAAEPAADAGERRQITVLFSDLVGSTALSTRMDPEDLRKLISAYQKCVAETVRRFGGFVAKYMGDGVLVYFGYPEAHEDDAERAVRSGLELVAAVAKLKMDTPLQTRVGIATGLVVVGDLVGSGQAQERGIVGETPNLAARLQGLAEPDMVVIADATRRLLGNLFELQDLGHRELKGIDGAVQVWAALRSAQVEGRFEAFHADDLSSFVGREEESELLLRRWSRAKSGEGQVVLLSGEAGIGKSRLTMALLQQISDDQHTRLRFFCSPQRTDGAFYPIIDQLERAAGLKHDDTARDKLDKLDSLLARSATSPEDSALLAQLLSLPNDGRYPRLNLDPQQVRKKTLEALLTQVQAFERSEPVLLIFEDAHWTDPTSLELIGLILERIVTLRALLVITYRPEFQPPWIGLPHVSALTINRLGRRDIDAIVDRMIGNKILPAGIREDMIERTDGIPLFIEEMTKAVLEAENEDEARKTTAAIPHPRFEIPATLYASLMARLDRLGPAKELAQIGAAIGREFSHALIAAVTGKPQAELEMRLHSLISAGLLFRQGIPPHAKYLFKHALVQDAAYGTLLREPRRALHAKIAETICSRFADVAESNPELVARHYTEAGEIEKAVDFWGKAGERSLARSALLEALAQLGRALEQIAALPSTPKLRREQIRLQFALINPLIHVKGYAAPETNAAVEQARLLVEQAEALGEPLEDPLLPFVVLYGQWVANFVAFSGDRMRELSSQFLALAEKRDANIPLMVGSRLKGMTLMHTGEVAPGLEHLDRALARYDPVEHRPLAARFGQDARTAILSFRALALWLLGYPDAALTDAARTLSHAREFGQIPTLNHALIVTSFAFIFCGNSAAARANIEEVEALADEKGSQFWKAIGMANQGCALALTGQTSRAVKMITSGLAAFRSTGSTLFTPWYLSNLAKAHAELGQFDDAWRCLDEALLTVRTTKERWCEAEIHRVAGEVALLSPQPDVSRAEAAFERALSTARTQQEKSWELRAATSMARLWRDQGKGREARELLRPIRDWFTEGFSTRDLQVAKALLDELHC